MMEEMLSRTYIVRITVESSASIGDWGFSRSRLIDQGTRYKYDQELDVSTVPSTCTRS